MFGCAFVAHLQWDPIHTHAHSHTNSSSLRAQNNIPVIHRSVVWLRVWETFTSFYVQWRFDESNYKKKLLTHTHINRQFFVAQHNHLVFHAAKSHVYSKAHMKEKHFAWNVELLFKLFGVTLAPAAVSFFFFVICSHLLCVYSRQFLLCVFLTDFGM